MASRTLWSNYPDKDRLPETIEVNGETFFDYAEGGFKKLYESYDDELAILPINGLTTRDKALHCAVIEQSNSSMRENGLETATEYTTTSAEVGGEHMPCLKGEKRNDLLSREETKELLEENPELQEETYNKLVPKVKVLYEEGETPVISTEFAYPYQGELKFQPRNFRFNRDHEPVILDTGELHPEIHLGWTIRNHEETEELNEEYSYADKDTFRFDSPYDSWEDYLEDHEIITRAEEILEETGLD